MIQNPATPASMEYTRARRGVPQGGGTKNGKMRELSLTGKKKGNQQKKKKNLCQSSCIRLQLRLQKSGYKYEYGRTAVT